MKVIFEKSDFVNKLLGVQKIDTTLKYRKLQFVELCEYEGVYLAYNMLTQEFSEISYNEFFLLSKQKFECSDEVLNIIENWYAVPVDYNDINLYNQTLNTTNMFDIEQYINSYTILTTTDCNARCFYCYEKGIKHIDMTVETAHNVSKFIINNSKGRNVHLHWFGGEPLYNKDVIDIIVDDLNDAGVVFKCTMTSNGYLFDEGTVKTAKNKWNLKRVQITLDGTKDVYNRCKNYVHDDANPFARVCRNINLLLEIGITVKIRLNIGIHNYKNLFELSDFMIEEFGANKKLLVYVALLFDLDNKRIHKEKQELVEHALNLEQKLYDAGLSVYGLVNAGLKLAYCMADNIHSTLINPKGELARCEHYADSYTWGTVLAPNYKSDAFGIWKTKRDLIKRCHTCQYFIMCRAPKKCITCQQECDEWDVKLKQVRTKRNMIATYINKKSSEIVEDNNC